MSQFFSGIGIDRRPAGVAIWGVLVSATLGLAAPAAASLPVPTACVSDLQGANDEPGQKDLTKFCAEDGSGAPFELHTIVDWDELTLGGANTQDICQLFDSDDDGLADLAVCTTLIAGPTPDGTAVLGELRLFRCGDTKPDRCANSTFLAGPYTTTCEVSQEKTDPFSPAAVNGPGDAYPFDTQILCAIDLNEFGLPGTQAALIDACSFPSTEPNSDPSDCVAFRQCSQDSDCDDHNVCTNDSCDNDGNCLHKARKGKTACDDGFFCDGDDECNDSGLCQPSTSGRDCSDGVTCTVDSCDELTDSCLHEARNTLCSDGVYCDGVEVCDPVNDCQAGPPVNCNDNVSCTVDTCDEQSQTCKHAATDSLCDDKLFCNGNETCSASLGCQAGTPVDCNDNVNCTVDACNEAGDQCTHTPNNTLCSDGQFCDGVEICDVVNGCEAGAPVNCDDGIGCTNDSCNEAADKCDHAPQNNQCDDGQFCNGNEFCDPASGCKPGTDPCPQLCNEGSDQCVQCLSDADCNDNLFCNGTETCNVAAGLCVPGAPPNCNDGVSCTVDSCNEATDQCDHAANNALCSDGQFCNGAETCDAVQGCKAGTAPDCNDGVACTVDQCNETTDQCDHTASNDLCSDGQFCNGVETCDPQQGCQAGAPPDCTDSFDCTVDSCNETTDQCDHAPDNTVCSDGVYCNGDEICDPQQGCTAGAPVVCHDSFNCSTDTCVEETHTCNFDFSTCVCGDGEVTGTEQCDPPAKAGTFEDCNNGVDDDGDGEIDCRDKDCKPNARGPLCDETCQLDQVCTKFIRDPATITFSRDGGLDRLYMHGRIPISGRPEPLTDGLYFELANNSTTIYRAALGWGDMHGRMGGKKYYFQDPYASVFGEDSPAGGIESVRLKFRLYGGRPYIVFTLRAYGDLSAADQWLMTTQMSIGNEVGFLTDEWQATATGWTLHQAEF